VSRRKTAKSIMAKAALDARKSLASVEQAADGKSYDKGYWLGLAHGYENSIEILESLKAIKEPTP
jgi:hypothetical protein